MAKRPTSVSACVIPWEGLGWGVEVNLGDGKHDTYPVGSREEAEQEARRLLAGGRPRSPRSIARLVKKQHSAANAKCGVPM